MNNIELIKKLETFGTLEKSEFSQVISTYTTQDLKFAQSRAVAISKKHFGNTVYIRGLIEFTNICRQDCFYCGLRCSNKNADRYRLTESDILKCCDIGYPLGFRTFVLQGGEDPYFDDEKICRIVKLIKYKYPDCAITLSVGEKSKESYKAYFDAGADRYLLRHETANIEHYSKLHPQSQSLEFRKQCLYNLKEIGFQTGSGFMVGSPFQTSDTLAEDMLFLSELGPHMVGIGPFIPHRDTPFGGKRHGGFELTLLMLALTRIMLKKVLLPSTTALSTINPLGREYGILSGANVVMPNLSPANVRKKYLLYDNKAVAGCEAAEGFYALKKQMQHIGYEVVTSRGDFPNNSFEQ